ncbi:MAG: ATP-binding protein [archaeon]
METANGFSDRIPFVFSEGMLERLFRHNIMPLFICDKKGEIVSSNLKFSELTEYNESDLVEKRIVDIFEPETEEEKQKFSLIELGFFKDTIAHDVILVTKKNEKRNVLLWIDANFDDSLSLAAVEDYTEKRKMELQLQSQNEKLSKLTKDLENFNKKLEEKVIVRTSEVLKANEEIKLLLERKNQFINELAHDLRTPLTPITYLTESLKTDIKDPELQKDLKVMEENAKYLKILVEDILKLARIDNNKVEFDFVDTDLNEIVNSVISKNSVTFKKLNMSIVNKLPNVLSLVYIDKLRITEVFENLIMNATKFMDPGGVVEFYARENGEFMEIRVKDNGIGIEQEHIKKLFQEFYKVDSARNPKSGTGLGLSICKRLVEKHGGKIWVESEGKGKGTSIIFSLKISKYIKDKPTKEEHKDSVEEKYEDRLAKLSEKLKKGGSK